MRAVTLCRELKKGADGRLESIEGTLLRAVLDDQDSTAGVRCSVAELLHENRLGRQMSASVEKRGNLSAAG
jgi:hypothetical protein